MHRTLCLGSAIVSAVLMMNAQPVSAATVTSYVDKSAFLAATSATSATGPIPTATVLHQGSSTFGTVTVDAPRWFTSDVSSVMPGGEILVSQGAGDVGGVVNDGIDVSFAAAVDAAGFDFFEPTNSDSTGCNTSCVNSTYVVRLMNGSTVVQEVSLVHNRGALQFFGLSADVAFTGLRIRELVGTDDNEMYGQFYTHAALQSPPGVPEPATVWMALAGLVAAAVATRRRGH